MFGICTSSVAAALQGGPDDAARTAPSAAGDRAELDAAAAAMTATGRNREDDASSVRVFSTPCLHAADTLPSWLDLLHVLAAFAPPSTRRRGRWQASRTHQVGRSRHQRGEHDGLMSVRGRAPDNLPFRLGPTDRGAWFRDERLLI